jgi:hypothetical protein
MQHLGSVYVTIIFGASCEMGPQQQQEQLLLFFKTSIKHS